MKAELLNADDFIDIIQKEKPELILFARFPAIRRRVIPYIKDLYDEMYQSPDHRMMFYVLKRISDKVSER